MKKLQRKKLKDNQKHSKNISCILNRSEYCAMQILSNMKLLWWNYLTMVSIPRQICSSVTQTDALQRKLLQTRELRKIDSLRASIKMEGKAPWLLNDLHHCPMAHVKTATIWKGWCCYIFWNSNTMHLGIWRIWVFSTILCTKASVTEGNGNM